MPKQKFADRNTVPVSRKALLRPLAAAGGSSSTRRAAAEERTSSTKAPAILRTSGRVLGQRDVARREHEGLPVARGEFERAGQGDDMCRQGAVCQSGRRGGAFLEMQSAGLPNDAQRQVASSTWERPSVLNKRMQRVMARSR